MAKMTSWKKIFERDLDYICDELKEHLEGRSCLILSGEVGAGKTTFIQHFMKGEGTSGEEILSPTYSIINENGNFAHADFYRIVESEEIIHLEMELYAEDKNYFLIEWGISHLSEIRSQLGEQFKYYEINIEINQGDDPSASSRNIELRRIDS